MAEAAASSFSWPQAALFGHARVLVTDSDVESRRYIRRVLSAAGCAVSGFANLTTAAGAMAERGHDVIVLALDPRRDDCGAAVRVCHAASSAPVLVLAENGDAASVAEILEAEADDCLATPFDPADLRVRIVRLLRISCRRRGMAVPRGLGALRFDLVRLCVRQGRREIRLTSLEYRALWVLAQANGAAVSFRDIEMRIWGSDGELHRSSLRRLVRKLRRKLNPEPKERREAVLLSEPHFGYRLRLGEPPTELAESDR